MGKYEVKLLTNFRFKFTIEANNEKESINKAVEKAIICLNKLKELKIFTKEIKKIED